MFKNDDRTVRCDEVLATVQNLDLMPLDIDLDEIGHAIGMGGQKVISGL